MCEIFIILYFCGIQLWKIFSHVFQDNRIHIGRKLEIRVVTLGLDGAGKTTLLFKLKQDEFMQPIPTIGKFVKRIVDYMLNYAP